MIEYKKSAADKSETARIEAFSDGVFAIAVTLLVLDMKVPAVEALPPGARLLNVLLRQWPNYLAFVISFITILIMWINHHRLFQNIQRSNHQFLLINGLLLMGITFVPFPTALVSAYIEQERGDAVTAAAVYSGTYVLISILFNWLWRYASNKGRLLGKDYDQETVTKISKQYLIGPPLYAVAFALAFVSVKSSIIVCLLLAGFFALTGMTKGSDLRPSDKAAARIR